MIRKVVMLSVCALALVACDKKEEAAAAVASAAPPAAAASQAPAPVAAAAPAAIDDKDLPVKADYAGEVRTSITKANYKGELDKLEKM